MSKPKTAVKLGTPGAEAALAQVRESAVVAEEARDPIAAMEAALDATEEVSLDDLRSLAVETDELARKNEGAKSTYGTKALPALLAEAAKLREARRMLNRAGQTDVQIVQHPLVRKLEANIGRIFGSIPEGLRKSAEHRVVVDDLLDTVDYYIERMKSEDWTGNPWFYLGRSVRASEKLGILRPTRVEEDEQIAKNEFKGTWIGIGTRAKPENYVLAQPGVKLHQGVTGRLHAMRQAARVCSERYKAEQEVVVNSRDQRVTRLATTVADVQRLIDGKDAAHVAGYFRWNRKNPRDGSTREVTAFIEARGVGDGTIEILESSELRNIRSAHPEDDPKQYGVVKASLVQLKRALDGGFPQQQGTTPAAAAGENETPEEAPQAPSRSKKGKGRK